MDEWADPQFLTELPAAFGWHDGPDLRRALLATLDLYARVARATADLLAYPYPDAASAAITAWVQAALA